jgi:hypothetical protein
VEHRGRDVIPGPIPEPEPDPETEAKADDQAKTEPSRLMVSFPSPGIPIARSAQSGQGAAGSAWVQAGRDAKNYVPKQFD